MEAYRVGEVARRAGLTVRTLHHWDETGLLSPSRRTPSGHRLYGPAELERLQQVLSLRQMGFSLEEIREVLRRPEVSLRRVLALHIERLQHRIEEQRRLRERLVELERRLGAAEGVSADDLIRTIEATTMFEKYYGKEQLEQLAARREALGEEHLRAVEAEWPRLIEEMTGHMEAGTDPADPRVQALGARWQELVDQFTGGDPGIARSLQTMYEQEPAMRERAGLDPRLMEYVASTGRLRKRP